MNKSKKSIWMVAVLIATSHLSSFIQEGVASAPAPTHPSLKNQMSMMGFPPAREIRPEFGLAIDPSRLGKLSEIPRLTETEASWVVEPKSSYPTSMVSIEVVPSRAPLDIVVPMWETFVRQSFPSSGEWKTKVEPASGNVSGKLLAMRQSGSKLLILARFAEGPDGVYILSCKLDTDSMSKENISAWVEALHGCILLPWEDAKKTMVSGMAKRE